MDDQRSEPWKQGMLDAAEGAAGRVVGLHHVEYVWHARLVETALLAFGHEPQGRFYVEVLPPRGDVPRPDLILCHPRVGCLVIENKGVSLRQISGVENSTLLLERRGGVTREDPFAQSEKVVYRLQALLRRRRCRGIPLLASAVALPRVTRRAFEQRFDVSWPDHTFFEEAFASPRAFEEHVTAVVESHRRRASRVRVWSRAGAQELDRILTGTAGVTPARAARHPDDDATHAAADVTSLGLGVEKMAAEDAKLTPEQQQLARRSLLGNHWLFRGVAGSGKSVMLALSAANSLLDLTTESDTRGSRVLVCCYNRTLVQFLRTRIEERYERLTYQPVPPDCLHVTHLEGLLKSLIAAEPRLQTGLTWSESSRRAVGTADRFDALPADRRHELQYDAIYLDEAQDLHPDEIRLLRRLVRPTPQGGHTLVIFYDNAQNIYGKPQPVWEELGVKVVGRSTFLARCLRNTRPTLELAFNVLVGSFAPAGRRVATRTFADLASLRERDLVEERDGRFHVRFCARDTGLAPQVFLYATRHAESAGTADYVRRLVFDENVLPSDILILSQSLRPYPNLEQHLCIALGPGIVVRVVGPDHHADKGLPLLEEGVLTVSTIASAKGFDAAITIVLGCDRFSDDDKGRASFYVAATRARYGLTLSALQTDTQGGLLDEILAAARCIGVDPTSPALPAPTPPHHVPTPTCSHCRSRRLHAQQDGHVYFRCIDCTRDTPVPTECHVCGTPARASQEGPDVLLVCQRCRQTTLVHRNQPLT